MFFLKISRPAGLECGRWSSVPSRSFVRFIPPGLRGNAVSINSPHSLDLSTLCAKGEFMQVAQLLERFFTCSGSDRGSDRAAARALMSLSFVHFV